MKAILLDEFGGPEVLTLGEAERPVPKSNQVLIRVAATSVNRPDLMQRKGRYPPPSGESEILGLEAAGTVEEVGRDVTKLGRGDRVMALLGGGGYAEYATAYAAHVIPLPDTLSFEQAACIPEAYITAFQNIFLNARFRDGETILLHGGGGGVNTAAIQICRTLTPASRVIVTASTPKLGRVQALGAELVIDYKLESFVDAVHAFTEGRGADVILDHIGADYFAPNLRSLAIGGRLAIIATMSGPETTINLAKLMVKRQSIIGSVLRPRPIDEKADIIERFIERVMPHVATGEIVPIIHGVFPLAAASEAHRIMESSGHFGKLVLSVTDK